MKIAESEIINENTINSPKQIKIDPNNIITKLNNENLKLHREKSKSSQRSNDSKFQIKFPMENKDVLKHCAAYLNEYEQKEILNYPTVYYLNLIERKKEGGIPKQNGKSNDGWSKENGEFIYDIHDMIAYRYDIIRTLGKGSFGVVFKCYDYKEKDFIALKVVRCKKKLQKQGLVEVGLLRHLKENDPEDKKNIVKIKDHFYWRNHLCICFEMLSINLYEFLKNSNYSGFSTSLIRRFAIQILISLDYLQEHKVVHCDLKPENILLRKINKSGIKIIDFGSSCFEDKSIYTYIQSRFYRAPEIILGIQYTTAIDMWSFGCILYELFTGVPLFAGEDEAEQMQLIMEVKGVPPLSVIKQGNRWRSFFHSNYNPRQIQNSQNKTYTPNSK